MILSPLERGERALSDGGLHPSETPLADEISPNKYLRATRPRLESHFNFTEAVAAPIQAIVNIIHAIIIILNAMLIDYNAFMLIGTNELQKLLLFERLYMPSAAIPPATAPSSSAYSCCCCRQDDGNAAE